MPSKLKRSRMRERTKRPRSTVPLPAPVRAFVSEAGQFIEHWGFKRIQGEMWALVFLTARPLTATEIASRLGVSKALVSLAMNELLDYRVLLRVAGDDGRAQRLVPNEDLGEAIAEVLRLREAKVLERAHAVLGSIGALPSSQIERLEISLPRVERVKQLTSAAQHALSSIVDSLALFTSEPSPR